ncbi:coiled-coil domain-containing protein 159 isoform 2-T3 [Anomaloglossus baeobatrachus]
MKPSSPYTSSVYTHAALVSSEDMVNLSSQLLSQAKMITSLHQAIGRLERDRDLHIQRIQSLEGEVQRLAASRGLDVSESVLERKMDGLRQELSTELRHMEDRVRDSTTYGSSPSLRSAISISQEMNETKRLIWKEYQSLRRDADYMHQKLRRHEDDLQQQISEGQELKQAKEKQGTVLERILRSHEVHTQELARARADAQGAQRDVLQLRSVIGDLLDDVKILEGKVSVHRARGDRTDHRRCRQRPELSRSLSSSSAEDEHSQISLADISSEDTSYSLGAAPTVSRDSREKSSTSRDGKSRSDRDLSDHDLDDLSDSAPELNFSDL